MTNNKHFLKKAAPVFLFALLAIGLIGGTVAWLTAQTDKKNTFTVGNFECPEYQPDGQTAITESSPDCHLVEPSWDTNAAHKLLPGAEFAKNPSVGIGEGSEDAVVYVNVTNSMRNKVYFTINTGWEPVSGFTTAGSASGTYTSGLFKYTAGLVAHTGEGSDTGDTWTTAPLFSQVTVAENAEESDWNATNNDGDYNITVDAFLHQAKDANGNAITASTIETAALEAFGLNN